jgi:hypothetical protein
MKTLGIDAFYHKINKHILLAESYTEIKNLSFIIKSCRLKPSYILKTNDYELKLHTDWQDEFCNCLNIINKKIKINYNQVMYKNNVTTDLYYGLSLRKIYLFSKLIFYYVGKDIETRDNFLFISMLGIDNFWRTYYVQNNELFNCSPLFMGTRLLRKISNNLDVKYFKSIAVKDKILISCTDVKAWLSFCPIHKNFLSEVKKYNEFASDFITNNIIKENI